MTKRLGTLALVLLAVMTFMLPGMAAAEEKTADDGWEFEFVPYLWALALSGDLGVKGERGHVSMSFGDILDNMNIGAMGEFEVRKGRFGGFINPLWAQLESEENKGRRDDIHVDVLMDMSIVEFGVYYRLGPYGLGGSPPTRAKRITVDPYVGGRYTWLKAKFHVKERSTDRDIINEKGSDSWVDPIVGARMTWAFSDRWSLMLNGNIGGFGASSKFAWLAMGAFGYRFNLLGNDNVRFLFGYKALYENYEEGSGSNKFVFDATLHGPIFGLSIPF